MPSCNTYHLTWVSLTLDEGYLLTSASPNLECGVAPLGPPAPAQPPLLGRGVAPPGKNEGMEPKQKQYPAVDVTGDRSKV